MEKMSYLDLSDFDEYCRRRDDCWWKFLGDPACFLAGDITVSSSGCSTIMIRQMLPFIFVLLRLLHHFFLSSAVVISLALGWIAALHLVWIIFIMSCGKVQWSIVSRARLHDTFDTLAYHALSWLSGYFQGKFQRLSTVRNNVMNTLGPVYVHSGQFPRVLARSDTQWGFSCCGC